MDRGCPVAGFLILCIVKIRMATLRFGSSGKAVRALQRHLKASQPNVLVDGDFGRQTRSAVLVWQQLHGLRPDGVVGPKTRAALKRDGMTFSKAGAKPAALAGIVGAAVAGILYTTVPEHEGKRNVGYVDPVGIPTACYGDTANVVVGQWYSDTECQDRLERQLIAHAEPVLACTPEIAGTTYPLAAAVSFAYNVGVGAYCSSTMADRFRAGDIAGGCAQLSRWVYAKGQKLPGLVNRRADERALCERGVGNE